MANPKGYKYSNINKENYENWDLSYPKDHKRPIKERRNLEDPPI